jgi:glyoxylase-like metal-dependent hydrolase (beta-lactamase superfamily II)
MIRTAAVPLLLALAVAARGAGADFSLQQVGNGVWAAISSDTGKAGANAGFVIGDDGVAVIDTFEDPRPAADLLAEIRKITKQPIRFVINTHYHLDHVNGNDVFAAAGATIVAQRNMRAWVRTENLKFLGPDPKPESKARVQSLTLPNVVYDTRVDLYLGTRRIEVRYYPGHTGGDSVISVPDARVVFGGDLLWKDHVPNLIDATTVAWAKTLDAMPADYGASTWIPGHGGVATDSDVRAFRQYLVDLGAAVRNGQAEGKSGDALVQAILPGLRASYGKWGFFEDFAKANILQTAQEFSGTKKVPIPADR